MERTAFAGRFRERHTFIGGAAAADRPLRAKELPEPPLKYVVRNTFIDAYTEEDCPPKSRTRSLPGRLSPLLPEADTRRRTRGSGRAEADKRSKKSRKNTQAAKRKGLRRIVELFSAVNRPVPKAPVPPFMTEDLWVNANLRLCATTQQGGSLEDLARVHAKLRAEAEARRARLSPGCDARARLDAFLGGPDLDLLLRIRDARWWWGAEAEADSVARLQVLRDAIETSGAAHWPSLWVVCQYFVVDALRVRAQQLRRAGGRAYVEAERDYQKGVTALACFAHRFALDEQMHRWVLHRVALLATSIVLWQRDQHFGCEAEQLRNDATAFFSGVLRATSFDARWQCVHINARCDLAHIDAKAAALASLAVDALPPFLQMWVLRARVDTEEDPAERRARAAALKLALERQPAEAERGGWAKVRAEQRRLGG